MAASILDLLNVPRELALEFLATFARYEFALKKSGYAHGENVGFGPKYNEPVGKPASAVKAPTKKRTISAAGPRESSPNP